MWPAEEPLALHDPVIVEVERGHDLGRVSALGPVALRKCGGGCTGCSLAEAAAAPPTPERRIVRRASPDDAALAETLHQAEAEVRRKGMQRMTRHTLTRKAA